MFSGIMLYPEVLRKAHAELDTVVGPHRLPDFGDRDSLPYVNAVIKESMRWHSALPFGVPHATVADDEFRGYFIPAGTMLIPNTWCVSSCSSQSIITEHLTRACMHDPEVYEDPDDFKPERFIRDGKLDTSVRDPAAFVFGYGRRHVTSETPPSRVNQAHEMYRICPGRYFAETTLFINIACVLHVFDITPPLGEDGLPMIINHVQSDTLISWVPFRELHILEESLTGVSQLPRGLSLHHQAQICDGRDVDTLLCGSGTLRVEGLTAYSNTWCKGRTSMARTSRRLRIQCTTHATSSATTQAAILLAGRPLAPWFYSQRATRFLSRSIYGLSRPTNHSEDAGDGTQVRSQESESKRSNS